MKSDSQRWLHRFACLVVAATFLLLIAGASVTSNRAGLSVPDWPTTYGYSMFSFPVSMWVGNIFYEHGHRLIATTVGMLTIVLAVWLWVSVGRSDASRSTLRAPLPRWLRWLGVVALAAVIVQGLLGGLTVRFFLPPAVSIAHAGLAQAFFCLTIAIAIFTSRWWQAAAPVAEPSLAKTLRASAVATTAAIYMQLLLGASIRHANLGVIPHIGVAVIVTLLVIRLTIGVVRAGLPSLRWPACGLLLLLIAQVGLGVAALLVRAPKDAMGQLETPQILLPTLHMVTGALMLGVGFALTVCSHRLAGETRNAAVAVGGEAPAC